MGLPLPARLGQGSVLGTVLRATLTSSDTTALGQSVGQSSELQEAETGILEECGWLKLGTGVREDVHGLDRSQIIEVISTTELDTRAASPVMRPLPSPGA